MYICGFYIHCELIASQKTFPARVIDIPSHMYRQPLISRAELGRHVHSRQRTVQERRDKRRLVSAIEMHLDSLGPSRRFTVKSRQRSHRRSHLTTFNGINSHFLLFGSSPGHSYRNHPSGYMDNIMSSCIQQPLQSAWRAGRGGVSTGPDSPSAIFRRNDITRRG